MQLGQVTIIVVAFVFHVCPQCLHVVFVAIISVWWWWYIYLSVYQEIYQEKLLHKGGTPQHTPPESKKEETK